MGNQNNCCGNCYWCQLIDGEWFCTNEYSDNCSCETEYKDTCSEWESR